MPINLATQMKREFFVEKHKLLSLILPKIKKSSISNNEVIFKIKSLSTTKTLGP